MMELVALVAVCVALGILRPLWTTLLAASVPAALTFALLLMHEDVPGEKSGFIDLAWYAGMSLAVGGAFALATAAGVALGRATRGSFRSLSR
jgi:hypothetical protein